MNIVDTTDITNLVLEAVGVENIEIEEENIAIELDQPTIDIPLITLGGAVAEVPEEIDITKIESITPNSIQLNNT